MDAMTNWTPVEMPVATLDAFVNTLPASDERGLSAGPLPVCPYCSMPATGINVEATGSKLTYVTVSPCSHMLIAMYTLADGRRFG
jgi:hypothetical protein